MSNCFQLITKTLIMIISGSREKKDAAEVQFLFRVVWGFSLTMRYQQEICFCCLSSPISAHGFLILLCNSHNS